MPCTFPSFFRNVLMLSAGVIFSGKIFPSGPRTPTLNCFGSKYTVSLGCTLASAYTTLNVGSTPNSLSGSASSPGFAPNSAPLW